MQNTFCHTKFTLNQIVILLAFTISSIFLISCKKNDANIIVPNIVLAPNEFIHYTVNSVPYSYDRPIDSLLADDSLETPTFNPHSKVLGARIPNVLNDFTRIDYSKAGSAVGSSQTLIVFSTPQTELYPYPATTSTPILINITEYGAVGQYISGNFLGLLIGAPPGNTLYYVTCSFRVKRRI